MKNVATRPLSDWVWLAGRTNPNADAVAWFTLKSSGALDVFGLFDSRGSRLDGDKSECFSYQLCCHLADKGRSALMLCRPLDITVFFTLFNFLHFNDLKAKYLITNLGFVDFTPKKDSIIRDVRNQKNLLFPDVECRTDHFEEYRLANGNVQRLACMDVSPCAEAFIRELEQRFDRTLLMETPEFNVRQVFSRMRPASFYSQLENTNRFLRMLNRQSSAKIEIAEAPAIPESYLDFSNDGVHYTAAGHDAVFESVVRKL